MTDLEIHCPKCGTLLFKAAGTGAVIEIHCKRCDLLVRWPSLKPEVVDGRPASKNKLPTPPRRIFE